MTFQDGNEPLPETSPSLPEISPVFLEASSSPPEAPSAPVPQRSINRWKVVTLALAALLILGVLAAGSLYVLGTRGVGPLASSLRQSTPTPAYQGPQAGNWTAVADKSGLYFTFQVPADRQTIKDVVIQFETFKCQFLEINGRFIDSSIWRLDGQKLPEVKIDESSNQGLPLEFVFRGSFDTAGQSAAGTWDFNLIDTTGEPLTACSGTWNGSVS